MVEKFNFYDIYGYLLPGLVLIGLFWLPFGLILNLWPKAELSSALLVLLLASDELRFACALLLRVGRNRILQFQFCGWNRSATYVRNHPSQRSGPE